MDGLEQLPGHPAGAARRLGRAAPRPAAAPRASRTRWPRRGLFEIAGWSFAAPELPDRLRLAPDDPRRRAGRAGQPDVRGRSRSCARRCWARCSTTRAATRRARRRATCACSSSGAVYVAAQRRRRRGAAGGTAAALRRAAPRRRRARPAATLPTERLTPARCSSARRGRRRGATPSRRRPTSSPPRACSRRVLGGAARAVARRARRRRAVPAPRRAPRGCPPAASRSGWLGELHPPWRREWELERRRAASRSTSRRCSPVAPGAPDYEDVTSFPAVRQDLASSCPTSVPAGRVLDGRARAGGALLRHVEVFDVYAGAQVGEGAASLALRLEFRAADRTLTDEEVAASGGEDRSALRASSGASCVAERVAVLGASGYAGALRRALLWRHPSLRARGRDRAQRRGRRLDDLYPRHRVPLVLEELDLDRHGARRRGDRRLPARRRRAGRSRSCASAACGSSISSADFRLRDRAIYERLVRRPTARRSCIGDAVYGLPELTATQIARRGPRRQPGLLPDRGDPRAGAAGPRRARSRRRHRREVRRVGRRPRADADHALRHASTRTSSPTRSAATATRRRSSRSSRRLGAPVPVTFTPHLVPLDQGELVSCYVTPRAALTRTSRRALRARPTRASRSSSSSTRRRACATCARRTSAASPSTRDRRTGQA